MSWQDLDLQRIQQHFPDLLSPALSRDGDGKVYRLRLPRFPPGREFRWAELRLPRGFPDHARAKIAVSTDAVMRIPHVEGGGFLCTEGDPGPGVALSPDERVLHLLQVYHEEFLKPWLAGALDGDFETEALNYWVIEVARSRSDRDPVRTVWIVDQCPSRATIRRGLLLIPARIVVAADEHLPITNRLVGSLGDGASQRIGVLVADIPLAHRLTPESWPRTAADLDRILRGRLEADEYRQYQSPTSRRGRKVHRVVLLRNPEVAYAFLLPGGPPTVLHLKHGKKTYPSLGKQLPLDAVRVDPAWTVGRDQYPEVVERQRKHVVVFGAGALGSPVIDQLAKAGIGFITVVDSDLLSTANIGRHLQGAESIGQKKAESVALRINVGYPATVVTPHAMTAEIWLQKNSLAGVDVVLDLTGEPDVRWHVDQARRDHPCPLVIGWMEPYVSAAHVCLLPEGMPWMQGAEDILTDLEAVTWPNDVIRMEPGCSSRFQSYTAAAAAHAVALVAENTLDLIDGVDGSATARVISWVRGQRFLDRHWPGVVLRDWALFAAPFDGLILERPFP